MSKTLLIVLFAALCSLHAHPQAIPYVRVKGRITDKETRQPLENATVALLYAKDSSRAAITFTDKNGAFILDARPGAYHLHITYLGYQQQLKPITIAADTLTDAGVIPLQKTGVTLGMVEIVEIRAPMVVKKDTLEFNADYYKTRENALMEELLKKLPGIEIDKEGNLKVNGEIVKRILVDGKPYFGDDPKLALRNLPADMIDKIQLVDRKSDQAQFSGAGDSQTEKVVNVTVKKQKKERFLGRLSAGYGTNDRFAANLSLNRFGSHPLSILGDANNINSIRENGIQTGGAGITRNWSGGVNYNMDVSKTLKVSASYYVGNMNTVTERTSARQNLLPDTTYYYNQHTSVINNSTSHSTNLEMEYKPDTMNVFTIKSSIAYSKGSDSQENVYESLGGQKQLVNKGTINNRSTSKSPYTFTNIFWGKRFKKAGRTLSAVVGGGYSATKQQQFNHSNNLFIQPGGELLQDTIDQRSDIASRHRLLHWNIIYTEPLYKHHFLDILYVYKHDRATAEKFTYDYNTAKGIYDRPNDSLSNSFINTAGLHQVNISLRTQKPKYDYTIGLQIQLSQLSNNNISEGSHLKKRNMGFFPVAMFSYTLTNNRYLRFNYSGYLEQPDLALLQPVPNNNNPLYIQLGNPDLKAIVTHSADISYNTVNPVSFRNLMVSVNAALTRNKVVMATWLDSLGRQVSQPLNANGAYTLGMNMATAFPIKKKQANINTNTRIALNKDINYTNGQPGNVMNITASQGISCNYTYKQLSDFSLEASLNYNGARYSQQKENNINVYTYALSFNYNITLPLGFNIGGNINYQQNTGLAAGYNVPVVLANAFVAKNIFRDKQGLFRLQGCDLFNRNQGYVRNFGVNYLEDVQTKVLQRFFMFSFTYFLK